MLKEMRSEDNFRKLLELYFNGSASSAQEEELRRRFLAGDVPEDCVGYRPLFGYIAQERADAGILVAGKTKIRSRRRRMLGIAAAVIGIAAVFAAVWVFVPADCSKGNAGYVLTVGGRQVADETLAMEIADIGLSRLKDVQMALDQSLGAVQVRMAQSDSTVAALEESVLLKFKIK